MLPRNALKGGFTAFALHELKRTKEAWDTLFAVADRLGQVPTMAYNLACYACQLGNLETALEWLRKSFQIGGKEFKLMGHWMIETCTWQKL